MFIFYPGTMKKKFYPIVLLLSAQSIQAQIPEETIRLSWLTQNGTARNQAIGGAMGSLGGDATAALVNPDQSRTAIRNTKK